MTPFPAFIQLKMANKSHVMRWKFTGQHKDMNFIFSWKQYAARFHHLKLKCVPFATMCSNVLYLYAGWTSSRITQLHECIYHQCNFHFFCKYDTLTICGGHGIIPLALTKYRPFTTHIHTTTHLSGGPILCILFRNIWRYPFWVSWFRALMAEWQGLDLVVYMGIIALQ